MYLFIWNYTGMHTVIITLLTTGRFKWICRLLNTFYWVIQIWQEQVWWYDAQVQRLSQGNAFHRALNSKIIDFTKCGHYNFN